jgi:hypothetical protein
MLWDMECDAWINPYVELGQILKECLQLFQNISLYEGVFKSFRTGRLQRELQMVQLSASRCSCIAIL